MDCDVYEVPVPESFILDCPLCDEAYESQRVQYLAQLKQYSDLFSDPAQVADFKVKLNGLLTSSIEKDMVARTRAAINRSNRIVTKTPDKLKTPGLAVAQKLTEVSPNFKDVGDKVTQAFADGTDSDSICSALTDLINKALSEKRLPMRESFERQIEHVIRKLRVARMNAERAKDFRAAIVAMKESKRLSENYERLYKPMVSALGFKRALKNLGNADREVGGISSSDWLRLAQISSSDDYRKMYKSVLAGVRVGKKEVINLSSSTSESDSSDSDSSGERGGHSQKKLVKAFTAVMAKMKEEKGNTRKNKSQHANVKGGKKHDKPFSRKGANK